MHDRNSWVPYNRNQFGHVERGATGAWLRKRHDKACAYVHCGGGFGRASTMAVGLLLLEAMPLEDAIEMLRSARSEIRINPEQLAWLRDVEARLADDLKRSG